MEGTVVALIFLIFWVVVFPEELYEALTFKYWSSPKDRVASIFLWIYSIIALSSIPWIITKL